MDTFILNFGFGKLYFRRKKKEKVVFVFFLNLKIIDKTTSICFVSLFPNYQTFESSYLENKVITI